MKVSGDSHPPMQCVLQKPYISDMNTMQSAWLWRLNFLGDVRHSATQMTTVNTITTVQTMRRGVSDERESCSSAVSTRRGTFPASP